MYNAFTLAAIADRMAAHFSYDARTWRPGHVDVSDDQPVPIRWTAGERSSDMLALVDALRVRTMTPYRSTRHDDAVFIVTSGDGEPPAATVTLTPDTREDNDTGVKFELTFAASLDARSGWFALRTDHDRGRRPYPSAD